MENSSENLNAKGKNLKTDVSLFEGFILKKIDLLIYRLFSFSYEFYVF